MTIEPLDPCECGHAYDEHQGTGTKCLGIVIETGLQKYCRCTEFTREEQP